MNYVEIEYKILHLRVEIKRCETEILRLRSLRSHPVVLPVMHWKEYRSDMESVWGDHGPDESGDLLRDAYGVASAMSENGQGWPVGVSVGGAFLSMDELGELYPGVPD